MENNQFDDFVKKSLEGIEFPFVPEHWNELANRLQTTEVDNDEEKSNAFDRAIAEKVTAFEAPFSERHWQQLNTTYKDYLALRQKIVATKLSELLFMALLSFAVFQWVDFAPDYQGPIAKTPSDPPTQNDFLTIVGDQSDQAPNNRKFNNRINHQSISANRTEQTIRNHPAYMVPIQKPAPEFQSSLLMASDAAPSYKALDYLPQQNKIQPIDFLSKRPTSLLADRVKRQLPIILMEKATSNPLSFQVYGSAHADRVKTGPVNDIPSQTVWAPGYGGGVSLTKEIGQLSVTLGAEYQYTQYQPVPIVKIFEGDVQSGYGGVGTSDVSLSMVQIPVTVGYDLYNKGKNKIKINAGWVGGIGKEQFQQAAYVYGNVDKYQHATMENTLARNLDYPNVYTVSESNTRPDKKKFYAFVRGGLTYERKLDTSHALFAEASITAPLKNTSIGAPKDKVTTIGLRIGSKVNL